MLAHSEVFPVELPHLAHHIGHQLLTERRQLRRLISQILELERHLRLQLKQRPLERRLAGGWLALAHAEKLKISTKVENVEFCFIRPVQQSGAQPGAPPDHLPELGLAHHLFEKDQVQHLRHVDAGVQHIHRDDDPGQLFRLRELVDGALGIVGIVVDDLGITRQFWIGLPEHL